MDSKNLGRRKLLSLFWHDLKYLAGNLFQEVNLNTALIRPPGAVEPTLFLSSCYRCGKCAQICPQKAIKIAGSEQGPALGTPYLKPEERYCIFCFQCSEVCSSGALQPPIPAVSYILGKAQINHNYCLAWQGQICSACQNICAAISFQHYRYPIINEDKCLGCGFCASVCLAAYLPIEIKPLQQIT